jgi:hypothetical protein
MLRTYATKSRNSAASLTKISVFVCLKNISTETGQQFGVFMSWKSRTGIWIWPSVRRYVVREKMLLNYAFLNFHRNYPLAFVVKLA